MNGSVCWDGNDSLCRRVVQFDWVVYIHRSEGVSRVEHKLHRLRTRQREQRLIVLIDIDGELNVLTLIGYTSLFESLRWFIGFLLDLGPLHKLLVCRRSGTGE